MSRKAMIGMLAVALTLVAGLTLLLFFRPGSGGGSGAVYMPGLTDDSETPALESADQNRKLLEQVSIDRTNVLRALATLSRPEAYRLTASLVYYYQDPGGEAASTTYTVTAAVEPGRSKTVRAGTGGGVRTFVHTLKVGERVYIWEQGSASVYEGSAGGFTTDDLIHMPTYEALLARADADITAGFIDTESDQVVVESVDPDTGYTERWAVSIREGLLLDYRCFDGGEPVFTATVQEAQTGAGALSDADFTLPDGTVPGV